MKDLTYDQLIALIEATRPYTTYGGRHSGDVIMYNDDQKKLHIAALAEMVKRTSSTTKLPGL